LGVGSGVHIAAVDHDIVRQLADAASEPVPKKASHTPISPAQPKFDADEFVIACDVAV